MPQYKKLNTDGLLYFIINTPIENYRIRHPNEVLNKVLFGKKYTIKVYNTIEDLANSLIELKNKEKK